MLKTRRATLADCGLINQLACKVFPETYKEILSQEQLDYMMEWMYSVPSLERQMKEEGHVYLLGYHDDEPIGYVSMQQTDEDVFHLQKIYVLPSAQGLHCGRFLFDEIVALIKQIHPAVCRLELNVNRHNKAIGFYERLGMKKIAEGDFDIGNGFYMNDYIMGMNI